MAAAMLLMLGVGTVGQAKGQTPAPNLANMVTAAEIERVRHKLAACVASEAKHLTTDVVRLRLDLDPSGSVTQVELISQKYLSDPTYRAATEALKRIMLNPQCQRWPLSSDNYQRWRRVTFDFDPKDYDAVLPLRQQTPTRIRVMIDKWQEANSVCRGGSPGQSRTEKACEGRSELEIEFELLGYCYGKQGEAGYQAAWHECGPNSLRRANSASIPPTAPPQRSADIVQAPATQTLPGPASGGYYVLIGVPVFKKGEILWAGPNGGPVNLREFYAMTYQACLAVVTTTQGKDLREFEIGYDPWGVVGKTTKRFGSFPTATAAAEALKNSGWQTVSMARQMGMYGNAGKGVWTAPVGCE